MAEKELSTILSSGDITTIQLGSTNASDKAVKTSDLSSGNITFDNSLTALVATTVKTAIEELADIGYSHVVLNTPYTGGQTIGTSYVKLSAFDTINHNIDGAVTPLVDTNEATPAHKFTINKTGRYRITMVAQAEFASADAVSLVLYKNGAIYERPVTLQGRGAGKPVLFLYIDFAGLTATDYLEVYALSDSASTSVLITGSSMVVEKMAI